MALTEEFEVMMEIVHKDHQSIKSVKERKYLDDYEQGFIDGVDETLETMVKLLKEIQEKIKKVEGKE